MVRKNPQRGFTLVEVLIVVTLLGILASVVIATFKPATQDARKASLSETLGTLRAQIQLYTLQHDDQTPDLNGVNWDPLVTQTVDASGAQRGPYLPSVPRNSLNNNFAISVVAADPAFGSPVADAGIGFVYNPNNGFIWATNTAGNKIYNEGDPQDPNN